MNRIIAHRGFSSMALENSFNAIEEALKYDYIYGIEIDVRMTKDDRIVLNHDRSIKRVSNGKGRINDLSLEELLEYDFRLHRLHRFISYIRSFTLPNGKAIRARIREYRDDITKLSTLEDIINLFDNKKMLLLEIKKEDNNFENLINNIYSIINEHKDKNIYIQTFNTKLAVALKEKDPTLKVGVLIGKRKYLSDIHLPLDFVSLKYNLINKKLIEIITNEKKELFIWTVDNNRQYNKMIKGIAHEKNDIHIISNYPDIINRLEEKRK